MVAVAVATIISTTGAIIILVVAYLGGSGINCSIVVITVA